MRKSFVNWNKVSENTRPESGRRYLIATIFKDEAHQQFATWYNQGDIVPIEKTLVHDPNISDEERLLRAIFGSKKEYIIPEAGFYTIDRMTMEDKQDLANDEFFFDCEETITYYNPEALYFTEEPLPPAGFLSEEEADRLRDAKNDLLKAKLEEERIEALTDKIENDEMLSFIYSDMLEKKLPISTKTMVSKVFAPFMEPFGPHKLSTYDLAKTIAMIHDLLSVFTDTAKGEGNKAAVKDKLQNAVREGCFKDTILSYTDTYFTDDKKTWCCRESYQIYFMYYEYVVHNTSFYEIRNNLLTENRYEDLSSLLLSTYAFHRMMSRIDRYCRLIELEAPTEIISNELRMIIESAIAIIFLDRLELNSLEFAKFFGVYPDGTDYEGEAYIGDLKRESLAFIQHFATTDTSEDDEAEYPLTAEQQAYFDSLYEDLRKKAFEEKEGFEAIVGDKYQVVPTPNRLCQKGLYALWNYSTASYYQAEDGQIYVYPTLNEAMKTCAIVNHGVAIHLLT